MVVDDFATGGLPGQMICCCLEFRKVVQIAGGI